MSRVYDSTGVSAGSNILICHINARSLLNNFNDFKCIVEEYDFGAVAVTETWLTYNISIAIPGYAVFRRDRGVGRGVGVALYVRDTFKSSTIITDVVVNGVEEVWAMVQLGRLKIAIGSVYRPPHVNHANLSSVDDSISNILPLVDNIFCMGDFNIDYQNTSSPEYNFLKSMINTYSLSQIILEPTRVARGTSTLIDLILTNFTENVIKTGTINLPDFSDHMLIFAELEIPLTQRTAKYFTYRDFANFDYATFQQHAQAANWTDIEDIYVPPKKIVITDESGAELTSVVGPFSEGASFTLRCDVYGGKPLPTVTWFRNDLPVTNESVVLPSGGSSHVRSELRISELGRRDVHSELTCQAFNNPRTQPLASTLHVDMNFGPLDVMILGANQPLSAGRRYDLLCQSSGSRPPATITWWKNGQRLEKTKETTSNDGNTTTSTLSFVAGKEDDKKYLSCRAENKVLSSEGLEDGWKLEIHYTPEARIILGTSLNPDTIREGTDVYFDCIVNAHPNVYKVEWRHNGKSLNHNVAAGVIISNQSLVLQGVSRSTAGNYTCVGYNTEGDGESGAFYLNVMYAPTCKPNQTRIYGVAKQERAQISCHVEANPPDIQFRWTFNNSADSVDVASSHIARSGTSSVVSYTPITELDYGTLLCYASNRIGHQRVPCVFHIIAAGRPDQVHNCTVSNISMTSFSVRCSEGFNGGLPQSFLLEVRESHSQEIKSNLSSPIARFSVAGLEPGAIYQAGLFSYNSKGRSEPVVLQAATLRLPEKQLTAEKDNQRPGFRFTPMMSVMIGVVSALLIVALVVIVVLRLQCTRRDGRRKRHKNGVVTGVNAEHRGSVSGPTLSDKAGGSPISKHDSSAGECDSDEKNPDIIPQPTDSDDATDYGRKRQHISTIETSPSRSLLHQAGNSGGYIGYCTLRNGIPLHEMSPQTKMHSGSPQIVGPYAPCTLPRQAPQWQYGPVAHLPPGMYPVPYRGPHPQQRPRAVPREPPIPMQPLATTEEEPSADTPLMINKRESTV